MPLIQPFLVRRTSLARGVAVTLLVAAAFFISARVGNFFTADGRTAAPIFPGTAPRWPS